MLRNLLWGASLASISIALSGCQPAERVEVLTGPTMGSTYTIKYVSNSGTPAADAAGVAVQAILDEVDRQMSTYRLDSDLSKFNQLPAGSCAVMPRPVLELISYTNELSELSDGQFDITIEPLLNAWGFGPNSRGKRIPTEEEINEAKHGMGYQYLSIKGNELCKERDLKLDLNSIAAGYTVDRIGKRFEELGISSYLIEVTGEIIAKGKKHDGSPWRIAIEQPVDNGERVVQRILELDGWGVNTSGDYRNYFEEDGIRFSHTLNPKTGVPVAHNLAAVTVIDRSALVADALGTVLLVLGLDEGMEFSKQHDVAALFVVREGDTFVTYTSPKFTERFPEGE
ncbi:FAD:protein FMN transferase [Thiopseudomonas acetoxidans]|uniref:FAD:protein FMN transferase n=1 Tax=Thiopseudomonas acetoxidans TaxID=3041622 RepID=A0ABT7SR01_9GAMM|nr:FAD:protein FMN transferase [Thiopseudomonas sp. CY1220]MDM7858626.1 FAD:protein FMN transferase [Thiopseudomonas sp. CY1220]